MKILLFFVLSILLISCSDKNGGGPECPYGDLRACTSGSTLGECRQGSQFCGDMGWEECRGEITPVEEVCDGLDNDCDGEIDDGVLNACGECGELPREVCNTLDDDCDGEIDEGFSDIQELCNGKDDNCNGQIDETLTKRFPCEPDLLVQNVIYNDQSSTSTCHYGWKVCTEGRWSACHEWVGPEQEVCNNLDDNCNGIVDDIATNGDLCGLTAIGECEFGIQICLEDELVCAGEVVSSPEICDGRDNNCNNVVDENISRICETECGVGREYCDYGEWIGCTAPQPLPESCNGFDDDCDSKVDEGIVCTCPEGVTNLCRLEECGYGGQVCLNQEWSECTGYSELPEICNNYDDNCNGEKDEDIEPIICYTGPPGTEGVGICRPGTSQCEGGLFGECEGQIHPREEACNGLDDDCDGLIDNAENVYDKMDIVFIIDVSYSMDYVIDALTLAINQFATSLQGSQHRFGIVLFGDHNITPYIELTLSPIDDFVTALAGIAVGGATEYSLDALWYIINPSTSQGIFNIGWRRIATPVVFLFADEVPQTSDLLRVSAADLYGFASICTLPGCDPRSNSSWVGGDPVMLYIFTQFHHDFWSQVVPPEDVKSLSSNIEEDYLRGEIVELFEEICLVP